MNKILMLLIASVITFSNFAHASTPNCYQRGVARLIALKDLKNVEMTIEGKPGKYKFTNVKSNELSLNTRTSIVIFGGKLAGIPMYGYYTVNKDTCKIVRQKGSEFSGEIY